MSALDKSIAGRCLITADTCDDVRLQSPITRCCGKFVSEISLYHAIKIRHLTVRHKIDVSQILRRRPMKLWACKQQSAMGRNQRRAAETFIMRSLWRCVVRGHAGIFVRWEENRVMPPWTLPCEALDCVCVDRAGHIINAQECRH